MFRFLQLTAAQQSLLKHWPFNTHVSHDFLPTFASNSPIGLFSKHHTPRSQFFLWRFSSFGNLLKEILVQVGQNPPRLTRTRSGTNATCCGKDLTWPSNKMLQGFLFPIFGPGQKNCLQVKYHSGKLFWIPSMVFNSFSHCQSLTVLAKYDKFLCWFEFRILHCFWLVGVF